MLRKGDKVARCSLLTHQLGWELRLITTDLLRSQVCRSPEEVLTTHEPWKVAMQDKGLCFRFWSRTSGRQRRAVNTSQN